MPSLSFFQRLSFAWVLFFRVLFNAEFASRAWALREPAPPSGRPLAPPAGPEPKEKIGTQPPDAEALDGARREGKRSGRSEGALSLLSLLQTEGRFVDFLQQDVASFSDGEVGAAARVVHEGCRRALAERVVIEPISTAKEGATLTLEKDYDRHATKLVGNVPADAASFNGTLRHKGWRAKAVKLPEPTKGHVYEVLCPAEVEL
jgi:hypothetical protein